MDLDDVLTRCRNARFTGVLLVRAKEAGGEIWLLSGIVDAIRFGTDTGDAAMQRIGHATDVAFELVSRLPGMTGGFKTRLDLEGRLGGAGDGAPHGAVGETTPVALMRYCEVHAITCELDLVFGASTVRASYADGELRSIEASPPSESVATLLESGEGRYRFVLPPPPQGIPVREPGKSSMIPPPLVGQQAPDSLGMRALAESRRATQIEASARPADAEIKRKAVEQAAAEAKRKADADADAKAKAAAEADAKRKADEQAAADCKRKADADADAKAKAKAAADADAKRKADEQAAADAKRKADADADAKAKAKADANVDAKAKAAAEADARRKADEQAAADAKRKADADADAKRKTDKEPAAVAKGRGGKKRAAKRKAQAEAARKAAEKRAADAKGKDNENAAAKQDPQAKGKDKPAAATKPAPAAAPTPAPSSKRALWIVVAIVIAAAIAASAYARSHRGWPLRSSTSSPSARGAGAAAT